LNQIFLRDTAFFSQLSVAVVVYDVWALLWKKSILKSEAKLNKDKEQLQRNIISMPGAQLYRMKIQSN
jgi:hypothetical protein